MTLFKVTCPYCQKRIPLSSIRCPECRSIIPHECGDEERRRIFIGGIAIVVSVIALMGCGMIWALWVLFTQRG